MDSDSDVSVKDLSASVAPLRGPARRGGLPWVTQQASCIVITHLKPRLHNVKNLKLLLLLMSRHFSSPLAAAEGHERADGGLARAGERWAACPHPGVCWGESDLVSCPTVRKGDAGVKRSDFFSVVSALICSC